MQSTPKQIISPEPEGASQTMPTQPQSLSPLSHATLDHIWSEILHLYIQQASGNVLLNKIFRE